MIKQVAALSLVFCLGVAPAFAHQLKVGDHVRSTVSGYDGTVVETGGIDGYVKISLDGHPPEHASWMNPKWWIPTGGGQQQGQGAGPGNPINSQPGGQPGGQGGMPGNQGQAPAQNSNGQPGAPKGAQVGSHVEFDRVEGSQPQFGRWDSGTVIGRDQFGRVQIKSDTNGITYNIQDNPRWILPGGSQPPGRRHDYNDHPVAPPATPPAANNPSGNRTNGGGAAGPFNGEWTVVSLDGQRYEPGAQNFNFVGNRYEILNQGMTMSGNFSVSGDSIKMISDDGTPFATFQYSMQGNQMVLSTAGTKYVLIPAHK